MARVRFWYLYVLSCLVGWWVRMSALVAGNGKALVHEACLLMAGWVYLLLVMVRLSETLS